MTPDRRPPRWLPSAALAVIGVAVITGGLVALGGTFAAERKEAHAAVLAERAALQRWTARLLRDLLSEAAAGADVEARAALADPLLAAPDVLWFEGPERRWPRMPVPPRPSDVGAILARLADPNAPTPDDDPASERLALVRALAAAPRDPELRARWLAHRAHHVLRADCELASTIVALEALVSASALSADEARRFLRDGIRVDGGATVAGLERDVLRLGDHLSTNDLALLVPRVAALARRAGVRVDDFLLAAAAAPPDAPLTLPRIVAPSLWRDWVLVPSPADPASIVGRRVARASLVARVVVGPDIDVTLAAPSDPVPLDALAPILTSERWSASDALADARYATKLGLLVGLGAATLASALLGLGYLRRRARAIEARSQLLSAVSHEIKTPIASIRALAETLEARLAEDPRARDYPTRIVSAADRLTWLVANVLSWSRLDRGAWRPRKTRFDVAELAAWIANDASLMQRPGRTVSFQALIEDGLHLVADLDLVKILLSNVVDNAIKYATRDTVTVTLSARSDDARVTLRVRDDGPGIPDGARKTLFDPYTRGGPASGSAGPPGGLAGHGLGLAIARQIMRLHRGQLQLHTTGPDGTTFEATFPSRPR